MLPCFLAATARVFSGRCFRATWRPLGALVIALAPAVQASVTVEDIRDYAPASQWQLSLTIGHGEMQSPLSDRDHIALSALPGIKYYGERFYLENTSLGYSLYESPRFALDLAGRLNSDGLFFPDSGNYLVQSMATMGKLLDVNDDPWGELDPPRRKLSYMGGFALHWLGPVNISLGAYRDITGVHGGDEVPLTLGRRFALGRFEAGLELGATYQSRALVDYYYGADLQSWEPEPLPVYHPGSALNKHAKLEARYHLWWDLSLVAAARLDRFDREIWESPFVVRREARSFFVGLQYTLW